MFLLRLFLILFILTPFVSLQGCVSTPSQAANACEIFKQKYFWFKAAKKSINSAFIDLGFKVEREQYLKTLKSEDRNEGLSSFKDKRDPNWKNK